MPTVDWDTIFAEPPTLQTERCMLRPITVDDVAHIHRIFGNADVSRYLGRYPIATDAEAREQTTKRAGTFANQDGCDWLVTGRADGEVIGTCALFRLSKAHYRAELGYVLLPAWWNQGLMTEVVTRALDHAFAEMALHSVEAQIDPANDASRALLEKLGFAQEAYFRENFYHPVKAAFTDTAVFSLLKHNWAAKRG